MKDSMILYTAYAEKFKKLTNEQFGKLIRLMIQYQQDGIAPEIEDIAVALAFDVVKGDIDYNNAKYKKVVERNKENGKKGGRPKTQNNPLGLSKTQKNPSKPKKADYEYEYDYDNEYDNTFRKSKQKEFSKTYVEDEDLNKAIMDFIEHRKKLRKPMTPRAIELFILKVKKLSNSTSGQIALINTAIERGWQSVYPSNDKKEVITSGDNSNNLIELERRALGE